MKLHFFLFQVGITFAQLSTTYDPSCVDVRCSFSNNTVSEAANCVGSSEAPRVYFDFNFHRGTKMSHAGRNPRAAVCGHQRRLQRLT